MEHFIFIHGTIFGYRWKEPKKQARFFVNINSGPDSLVGGGDISADFMFFIWLNIELIRENSTLTENNSHNIPAKYQHYPVI